MANYYLDFVGLNTFIYEAVNFSDSSEFGYNGIPYLELISISETDGLFLGDSRPINISTNTAQETTNFIGARYIGGTSYGPVVGAKNFKFPHFLPNTASYFCALMIHRNGPYGHPSWKQIRVGQNPLTRKQIKNSIFTHVEEPGPSIQIDGAQINKRYGDVKYFVETPVVSRFKPLKVLASADGKLELELKTSMGNSVCHFNNIDLDKFYDFDNCANPEYEQITKMYLNGGLEDPKSPINSFSMFEYMETIYPAQVYTNKSYTRQRTNFIFDWRDSFDNRKETSVDNGFGTTIDNQSIWPLDYDTAQGETGTDNRWDDHYGKPHDDFAHGILQNNYNQCGDMPGFTKTPLDSVYKPAPIYNRKHTLVNVESCVSKNGMKIEDVTTGFGSVADLTVEQDTPSGEAKWQAADQSGKAPFYDSYDDYVQGVRQRGKGYTIIPEFRISNHISTIVSEGLDNNFANMFELTGALASADGSDEADFYKIYSTSEFLKHFDLIKNDHKEFVDPMKITLKCRAIKKFLPYNGFYPCQRTVDLAEQFFASYSTSSIGFDTSGGFSMGTNADHSFQNVLGPLFAPGVLFNAIKGGVACDYPLLTASVGSYYKHLSADSSTNFMLAPDIPAQAHGPAMFPFRVPFKALVEPERFLSQRRLMNQEPHSSSYTKLETFWDGTGDNLYKMMAHNFLAEVPNFFLQGSQFSTIYSLPSDDQNVGNAVNGRTYSMRVKMYKTSKDPIGPLKSGSAGSSDPFVAPQYPSTSEENFTMYSRPTAFGPPTLLTSSLLGGLTGNDSREGENYPFTPPYYYGQAWADIKFTADATKKYTIGEIIRDSVVTYWRYVDEDSGQRSGLDSAKQAFNINDLYNRDAMQLSASVSLFTQGELKSVDLLDDSTSDKVNVAVEVSNTEKSRWVIQSLFETPMLNFNHYSASTSVYQPTKGHRTVPRGMWHQYGDIETDPSKGVFLQVTDIPTAFLDTVSGSTNELSLKDLCGFRDEPKRLGQVAQAKVIREAVVAIPFIEQEGQRKFFNIDPSSVQMAIEARAMAEGVVSPSIIDMVDKMQRFVIPPSLDFVNVRDVDPFAMYIFEFAHKLTQQDLADIWQNLSPKIGREFEEVEVSLSHPLLAHELLGGGNIIKEGKIEKGEPLPEKIRWMVFKAKQRAETNYYNKIVGEFDNSAQQTFLASSILRPEGASVDMSFNWPYDFFSLVELAQLDAEIILAGENVEFENETVPVQNPKIDQVVPLFTGANQTPEEFVGNLMLGPAPTQGTGLNRYRWRVTVNKREYTNGQFNFPNDIDFVDEFIETEYDNNGNPTVSINYSVIEGVYEASQRAQVRRWLINTVGVNPNTINSILEV